LLLSGIKKKLESEMRFNLDHLYTRLYQGSTV